MVAWLTGIISLTTCSQLLFFKEISLPKDREITDSHSAVSLTSVKQKFIRTTYIGVQLSPQRFETEFLSQTTLLLYMNKSNIQLVPYCKNTKYVLSLLSWVVQHPNHMLLEADKVCIWRMLIGLLVSWNREGSYGDRVHQKCENCEEKKDKTSKIENYSIKNTDRCCSRNLLLFLMVFCYNVNLMCGWLADIQQSKSDPQTSYTTYFVQ